MASFLTELPEPVVHHIMSRLPGESLVECKLVNRSWYSLISGLIKDPEFVKNQTQNTKDKSSVTLVFEQTFDDVGYTKANGFWLLTLTSDDGDKARIHCEPNGLNLPPLTKEIGRTDNNRAWKVVCHCDGILALVKHPMTMDAMLCNPLSKEFKILPESKYANSIIGRCSGFGFGYDSKANDYKFVRIVSCRKALAEVYTLGADSWRDISMPKDIMDLSYRRGLYVKGVCYWKMDDENWKEMILSFDLCDEVFHRIPFPDMSTFRMQQWRRSFTVWNDSVALFDCNILMDPGSFSFQVFVMADYRDILEGGTPWIKTFVVRPQLGYLKPLAFWNDEEVLLKPKLGRPISSYNIRTKELRQTGVRGSVKKPAVFYEKSLVTLRRR